MPTVPVPRHFMACRKDRGRGSRVRRAFSASLSVLEIAANCNTKTDNWITAKELKMFSQQTNFKSAKRGYLSTNYASTNWNADAKCDQHLMRTHYEHNPESGPTTAMWVWLEITQLITARQQPGHTKFNADKSSPNWSINFECESTFQPLSCQHTQSPQADESFISMAKLWKHFNHMHLPPSQTTPPSHSLRLQSPCLADIFIIFYASKIEFHFRAGAASPHFPPTGIKSGKCCCCCCCCCSPLDSAN